MRITNDGLIGIGTTAPDTNCFLHLEDSSLDVKLRIEATASNRAALLSLVGGASDKSAIDFGVTGGTLDAARIRYDSSDGKLHIINGDHSYPEITVTTTAVGIDTASPQRAFVISDQGAGGIEFGPGATTNIMSNFNRGTSSYATLQIESSAVKIYTGTSSDKLLNIDSSGNISGSGEIKNQDGTKIYTNERFGKIQGADGTTTSGAVSTPHTETIDMPEGSHILTATMGRTEVHIGAVYLIIVPPHGSNVINCSVTQLGYGSYASTSLIQVQNQNNGSAFAFNSNSDGIIKVIYTNDDSNNWQYWSWSYTTLGVVRT